jgi:hypothetical protein
MTLRPGVLALALIAATAASTMVVRVPPARAVLDIDDRGPMLDTQSYSLRVTNAGILGNAFFEVGRSGDPSFETPPGSGIEALHYAALWVGGRRADGLERVSGGPLLEFRPTLDPDDRVMLGSYGRLGAIRFYDDDNDGRIDEETLDGRDEDGDGEVDEDLGMFSQKIATARFSDDRPEAVNYVYPGGESHQPLGIDVRQEVYGWSDPGYDHAAGVQWVITNHSQETIENVYLGIFADLDSKRRDEMAGHLNDRVLRVPYSRRVYLGSTIPSSPGGCATSLSQTVPVIADADTTSGLPFTTVLPLWHTVDALANFDSLFSSPVSSAPRTVGFRYVVFQVGGVPGQGGVPTTDAQRYAALRGDDAGSATDAAADYAVLISCGPFPRLRPGQSVELHAALIAASTRDTLATQMGNLAVLEYGRRFNLHPDVPFPPGNGFYYGESGINGHEVCLDVPYDVHLVADPNCARKYDQLDTPPPVVSLPVLYVPGHCIWTDADCNDCTGVNGLDTEVRWSEPGSLLPPPTFTVTPGERRVRIAWDNYPEIVLSGGFPGWSETKFIGYRVWRLADWTGRSSLLPNFEHFSLAAYFGSDAAMGAIPLASITDTTLDYERILYEHPLYPVGRYAWEDTEVIDGFDYLYFVSAVYQSRIREPNGYLRTVQVESPIETRFDRRTVPRAAAADRSGSVRVVPNPYRGSAEWERPPVYGDAQTRHIDFVGLPRARSTIKIWTLAGDFVAQVDHDGTGGDGEASWDLISRNGQDVASGVYLFTVESDAGRQIGRFVVIR